MINNNQNQKIYFPNPNEIIMTILEKNNLKETIEEAIEKIEQKKDCRINIIYNISRDFAEGKILEKDFATHIQKQIESSAQTAENLAKDIKEKLLPLAIKVNIGETEKIETEKPIIVKPVRLINETHDVNEKNDEASQIAEKLPITGENRSERKKINRKNTEEIGEMQENGEIPKIKEIKRQPKKQDSYLEPIE